MKISGWITVEDDGKERLILQSDPKVEVVRVSQEDLVTLIESKSSAQNAHDLMFFFVLLWMGVTLVSMIGLLVGAFKLTEPNWVKTVATLPWISSQEQAFALGLSTWGVIVGCSLFILDRWKSRVWSRYSHKKAEVLGRYGSYPAEKVWLEDDIYDRRNGYVVLSTEKRPATS
jgi:hypothetical protein